MSLLIVIMLSGSFSIEHEVQSSLKGFCALRDLVPVYIPSLFPQYPVLQTSHNSRIRHILILDPYAFIFFIVLSCHVILPCSLVRRTFFSLQQKIKPLQDPCLCLLSIYFILLLYLLFWNYRIFEVKNKFLILLFTLALVYYLLIINTQICVHLNCTESQSRPLESDQILTFQR